MQIDITKEEAQNLIFAINAAIKSSDNAIMAAASLIPIAAKIEAASKVEENGNANS